MPDVFPRYSIEPWTIVRPGIYPQEPDHEEILGFFLRVRAEVVFGPDEKVSDRMMVAADSFQMASTGITLYRSHAAKGETPADALATVMRAFDRDGFEVVSAELDKMTHWRKSLDQHIYRRDDRDDEAAC